MSLHAIPVPKKYLLTGGCGFIGSHLADALIAKGHRVVVLDDLSTGYRENLNKQAQLIVGDTTDYETVAAAMADCDGCFHLAAIASVQKSTLEWARTHTVNVTSTVNVLQAASRTEARIPVVYTSSAAVYGDCPFTPIIEESETLPLTAYGVDKLSCDLHARIAWMVHKVPNIGLRPFNIYGPRQDPSSPYSGVISIFTDRIRRGQPITIFGDGEQTRDFVYVGDAVKAFVTAMQELEHDRRDHDIVNLCTGKATSIKELAALIAAESGKAITYNFAPPRAGDIRISVGSPAHLEERLGLTLNVPLRDGLRTTMGLPPVTRPVSAPQAKPAHAFQRATPKQKGRAHIAAGTLRIVSDARWLESSS